MPRIFISYRREDSAYPAHQIYRDLVDHFGSESVIFDVDTIPFGTDFREYLNKEVNNCDILIAIIGDRWVEILNNRLDEPNDFIRIEIQAALERKIPVVPILVGKASVPAAKDLPPELVELSYKQSAEVRAGSDYQAHLRRLIDGLDYLLTGCRDDKGQKQKKIQKHKVNANTYSNTIGMEFVLIPAGSFLMGSDAGTGILGIFEEENLSRKPLHKVKISQSYYLQTTQVTQRQWKELMGNNPSKFEGCGANCPVERVTWNNVQEFIKELNKLDNINRYRLPTEAEWEYACSAGTTTEYSFGDNPKKLGEYAWFKKNSGKKTHPVGGKRPNQWGLYDMHGNVWEWVEDRDHKNYKNAPSDGRAWVDEKTVAMFLLREITSGRVVRGGSWINDAKYCRSAWRDWNHSYYSSDNVGFRLVLIPRE